ncbi:hypothetical protein J6590_096154 [Homalodisca vitripennis]|nr:hypothetical protein J6590_096154 [Homalodisca vitripennis]
MEPEGVLVDLELSETSLEDPSQPSFEDLVGNKCSPILPLCTEDNPFDSSQERISHIGEIPVVVEINTLSESYLSNSTPETLFTTEGSQTSEITNISKESPLIVENNCIPSAEDNSCEQNISYNHTTTLNNTQINSYTNSKPGTSSECLNEQNIERISDESEESSTTKVISTWKDQESSFQQEKQPERVKRKVGRRPKDYYKDLKPTRESHRKKKCPKIMTYDSFGKEKFSWNVKDKRIFLKALEKWGPDNIKALHAEMPNKKESDIYNQIKMWKEFAHADLQKKLSMEVKRSEKAMVNCITKLDEWIQHFSAMEEDSTSKLFALSNVFLLISEYGNFPPPSECDNIDFR